MSAMPSKPLVSVVIPTYNRAYCICRTIDSVAAQTYDALEILIIDDGSTDGTADVIRSRFQHDARVVYHYQENGGVCVARNTGMALATGEYVALLDSDDLWEPWKLELQMAAFRERPEVGMIWSDMVAVDPSGAMVSTAYLREMYTAHKWFPTGELFSWSRSVGEFASFIPDRFHQAQFYAGDIFSSMVAGNLAHTSTVVMKRERIQRAGEFNPTYAGAGEDYEFFLRICREGPVGFVDLPTIVYQKGREDQITTGSGLGFARQFLEILNRTLVEEKDRITLSAGMLNVIQADAECWLGAELIRSHEYQEGRRHLVRGLRRRFDGYAFRQLVLSFLPESLRETIRTRLRGLRRRGLVHTASCMAVLVSCHIDLPELEIAALDLLR